MFVIILFSTVLFGSGARAENTSLYLFGGAGEPAEKNMFTEDFKNIIEAAHDNQWKIPTVLFDGNNPSEQAKLSQTLKTPVESFRPGTLQIALSDIQQRIAKNDFKKNEQVLILIDNHGQSTKNGAGHYLDCEGSACNLDDLKDTISQLEKKGMKVAVVDLSCYSGHSLDLVTSHTCVISETTANDVGWADFSKNFIKNMRPGQSLEQIFLKTRLKSTGRAQISTEAGTNATQTIESLASEARYNVSDSDGIPRTQKNFCVANSIPEIIRQSQQSAEILAATERKISAAQEYREASLKYQEIYSQIQDLGKKIEPYSQRFTNGVNWVALAQASSQDLKTFPVAAISKADLEKNNPEFRSLEKTVKEFQDMAAFGGYRNYFGVKKGPNPLTNAALRTQDAEKKLYDALYRGAPQQKENPCADFIL